MLAPGLRDADAGLVDSASMRRLTFVLLGLDAPMNPVTLCFATVTEELAFTRKYVVVSSSAIHVYSFEIKVLFDEPAGVLTYTEM